MRFRSSVKWLFVFGVLAYVAGPAGAQPGQPAGSSTGTTAAPPARDADVNFKRRAQLTPQEQVAEAQQHIARMEGASSGVRAMLQEARTQRDVVKVVCLNDKLSQIDVATRSAKDRRKALQAAAERNDSERTSHEFTIMTVLRQRTEQIVAEANQCIGEEAAFVGDTRVKTTVDPTIPPDETPYPPTDITLVSGPPQCTSCSL